MMNRAILVLLFLLSALPFSLQAQMPDSIVRKLSGYIEAVQNFGEMLPQEKVYLHFDNTSYYQGDPVWFQCYVVTSELNPLCRIVESGWGSHSETCIAC
jgi:hypothetical protein